MVGPRRRVDAVVVDPRTHHPEPGVADLLLEVAVVPREARADAGIRPAARREPRRRHEEVGVAEQRERRRALRVGGDHVQRLLLHRIGKGLGDVHHLPVVEIRVGLGQVREAVLE